MIDSIHKALDELCNAVDEGDNGVTTLKAIVESDKGIFSSDEILLLRSLLNVKPHRGKSRLHCRCSIREKSVLLKPEEVIRQLWVLRLINRYHYPKAQIRVEYRVTIGTSTRKADIVIVHHEAPTEPYIIVEVKKTERKDGKEQLKSYCNASGAPIAVWSNGQDLVTWNRQDPNHFLEIPDIPDVNQTIEDITNQPWTIDTLIQKEEQRASSGQTLRHLIKDIEDEVLANSGHDVFEEVFKLLFTKMFDEVDSYENGTPLRFRNTNDNKQFANAIQTQFDKAKDKWPGVFAEETEITLDPNHLRVCVGTLEGWKLFNSNLDILDDAFEYLISKSAKGEKGQFFTPRWVIDMCVRMMDPKENESIIDPACGSAGFLIHAAFYVWRKILDDMGKPVGHLFSAEPKPPRCSAYVRKNVFGIDFDERVVRVARCINLIAGDGETNVLHLNSLDWKNWQTETAEPEWLDVYSEGWKGMRKKAHGKRNKNYRQLNFDICFANPPFAGKIKQSTMLALYQLSQKTNGKMMSKMDRDILFVERCIDLLTPGGRMAIVLPEGRFNNTNDQYLRQYILDRCRILAVVSLDPNTFKPHTGISTCVLFVQKWNDQVGVHYCPRRDDYDVFFAVQNIQSIDNRGLKVYVKNADSLVRDSHGHLIVQHDLFNHDSLTQDGVAEAFEEWARRQELSFAQGEEVNTINNTAKCFRSNIKDIQIARRCDAQFFNPEHKRLIKDISKHAIKVIDLGDILTFNRRGVQPKYVFNGDVDVIQSGNIKEGYIDYADLKTTTINHCKPIAQLYIGDILLYATGANLGRTAVYDSGTDRMAMASNHVNIIRIKFHNPLYIAFILNSPLGRQQTSRYSTGSAQREIYPDHISQIQIPVLSEKDEESLVNRLADVEEKRRKSLNQLSIIQSEFTSKMRSVTP